jgi:release factor glutamine methyltransferase
VTRAEALKSASTRLQKAGVDQASDDARRLLLHALDISHASLIAAPDTELTELQIAQFERLIARREQREPLSQILGKVGFWTLELAVSRDVLTPRSDTERLVELAIQSVSDKKAPLRILDIGTGSGAITLALLSELPNATAVATDKSEAALTLAQQNAKSCCLSDRCTFIHTSWSDGIDGPFDLVVSNPPYIATEMINSLDPEVREYEPSLALDGGETGLEPYRILLPQLSGLLKSGGQAFFEIGYDQGDAILALANELQLDNARIERDLAGHDRVLCASLTK